MAADVTTTFPAFPAVAPFGTLPDGRSVEAVTLTSDVGVEVRVLTYGATVQSVVVPDASGVRRNVAVGFARLDDYLTHDAFFGATIGRFANRILDGRFELDG